MHPEWTRQAWRRQRLDENADKGQETLRLLAFGGREMSPSSASRRRTAGTPSLVRRGTRSRSPGAYAVGDHGCSYAQDYRGHGRGRRATCQSSDDTDPCDPGARREDPRFADRRRPNRPPAIAGRMCTSALGGTLASRPSGCSTLLTAIVRPRLRRLPSTSDS